MAGRRVYRRRKRRKKLGYTNLLSILLLIFLAAGLLGGYKLAELSIQYQYTGALACWTIVFTPIGTAVALVIGAIVNKSKAENTGPNGEGIVYAKAQAMGFVEEEEEKPVDDAPPI